MVFGIIPECRSGSYRNERSTSPESPGELQTPVINETQLKGKYDYSVSSKLSEPEFAFDLAHQLGLELTKVSRPIEMLVVRKVQ